MGLYSTVTAKRLTPCPRCGHDGGILVQIHYGDTCTHHDDNSYEIGDLIEWGERHDGAPAEGTVEILGYPGPCPVCGLEIDGDYALTGDAGQNMSEYVLTITDGRITRHRQATAADVKRLDWACEGGWPFDE